MFNEKKKDSYFVMMVFAYIATVVASVATYDIALHFSPADVAVMGTQITKQTVAFITLLTVDGLYILLDNRLPHFKTDNSRQWAVNFLMLIWAVMLSLNIASAVMNNTMDTSVLGKFSFVIYAVKVVSLVYLAFYTYIRTDDPDTKRIVIENQMHWLRESGVNTHLKTYSNQFSQIGAKIIAMDQLRELVLKETGKDIEDILGLDWQVRIGGEMFAKNAGKPATGKPLPAPRSDAGNDATPPAPTTGKSATGSPALDELLAKGSDFLKSFPGRVNSSSKSATGKTKPSQDATTGNPATGTVNP